MSIGTSSNMEWLAVNGGGGGSVEYAGGHGIDVDNNSHVISVNQSEIQDKLTAGNNITITNNVISAADQVQSDWTESNTSSKAYIAHKPTIPTATSDLTNDSNFITASDVPSSQVQSDWTEADSSNPAYIAHKPSIPTATSDLTNDSNFITASDVPSAQVQSDWNESDSSSAAYIANKPTIPPATVVDQTYDATSTNAQSGTAVADALSGVRQVPSASSSDNGKVLGVTDGSGTLGWVAQAEADLFYVTYNVTTYDEIKAARDAGKWPVLVESHGRVAPLVRFSWIGSWGSVQYAEFQVSEYDPHSDANGADYYNLVYRLELYIDSLGNRTETWSTASNNSSADWNAVIGPRAIRNKPTIPTVDQSYSSSSTNAQSGTAVSQAISAVNQVPSSTSADEGKVLTVDSNGDAAWATGGSVTQVQSDWTETDTTDASFIQHKPTTKPIAAGNGISVVEYADNVTITNTAAQVQSDWAESTATEPDYIKNKPTVKQIVAGANVTINESSSQITISSTGAGGVPVQANWTQADSNQPDYIKNKPTIPLEQVQSNWTETNTSSKAFVLNKPVTKPIVAGNGIVITETATEIIISLA